MSSSRGFLLGDGLGTFGSEGIRVGKAVFYNSSQVVVVALFWYCFAEQLYCLGIKNLLVNRVGVTALTLSTSYW